MIRAGYMAWDEVLPPRRARPAPQAAHAPRDGDAPEYERTIVAEAERWAGYDGDRLPCRPARSTHVEILESGARGAQRARLCRAVRSAKREAYIRSVTF